MPSSGNKIDSPFNCMQVCIMLKYNQTFIIYANSFKWKNVSQSFLMIINEENDWGTCSMNVQVGFGGIPACDHFVSKANKSLLSSLLDLNHFCVGFEYLRKADIIMINIWLHLQVQSIFRLFGQTETNILSPKI